MTKKIIISIVWEELIDNINENSLYLFKNFSLENYFDVKLTPTKLTFISVKENSSSDYTLSEDVTQKYIEFGKQLNNRLNPKLCCPEIMDITLDIFISTEETFQLSSRGLRRPAADL